MTNEEAIGIFEGIDELEGISMFYEPGGKAGNLTIHGIKEASKMAITALRAQRAPAKLDRSRWKECGLCKGAKIICGRDITAFCGTSEDGTANIYAEYEQDEMDFDYCPNCGRPLTEDAWAELERRINGETTDN